jgi:DNA-binding transcriptional LysR family regulator
METTDLNTLTDFLTIAEERSFTQAAKRLGVSPSALSHSIRKLEEELGVRLLSRTTRSVATTEAGEQFLARLRPALTDVHEALHQLSGLRDKPAGRLRLLIPRVAGTAVLGPKLARFTRDYPDVVLDITADDTRLDIVAGGFDAGIQFGEFIQKDMIAVRVSKDLRAAIVGSSGYFKSHPKPKGPRDLMSHRCINFRHGHGGDVYRWEFEKGRKSLSVAVNGPLIVDDVELAIRAAVDGIGLAFMGEDKVVDHLASGALIRVLEDWCQPFPGFFLYYPSRRQQPAALAALIDTLRLIHDGV